MMHKLSSYSALLSTVPSTSNLKPAVMHSCEIHEQALKPTTIEQRLEAGLPDLPFTQTYVPPLNRKSKRW